MVTVMLHKPEAGQSLEVSVMPGQTYHFDFFTDSVTFDQKNADVQLLFEDGAQILFRDFLRVTVHDDFFIELPDGALLSGKDVAHAMSMVLEDFHTDSPGGKDAAEQSGGSDHAASWPAPDAFKALTAPHEDDLTTLLEPKGQEFSPLCDISCDLSHASGLGLDSHGTVPERSSLQSIRTPDETVRSGSLAQGTAGEEPSGFDLPPPVCETEVLQLADLLDTSQTQTLDSALHAPAFESLLGPLSAPSQQVQGVIPSSVLEYSGPSHSDTMLDSSSEQLLCAFFGLGTF